MASLDASPENAIGPGGGGNGFHGFRGGPGFDIRTAIYYRTIHGILAATSIAVLFPVGGILMRVIPGRLAIWVHAIFQIVATIIFIVAAGLGIYPRKECHYPGWRYAGKSISRIPYALWGKVRRATVSKEQSS